MNEMDERICRERIAQARLEERANSITRIVIVCLFLAGSITHWRLYGWLLLVGLFTHLMRLGWSNKTKYPLFQLLEVIFVIIGSVALMGAFMGRQ
jgi:hypothetical protein